MLEQELGCSNANVATALLLEAAIALCRGQAEAAETAARRALDIRRRAHGSGSKEAAAAMCTLSDTLRELGRSAGCCHVSVDVFPCTRPCSRFASFHANEAELAMFDDCLVAALY